LQKISTGFSNLALFVHGIAINKVAILWKWVLQTLKTRGLHFFLFGSLSLSLLIVKIEREIRIETQKSEKQTRG
jgi:hypothetical protein